MTLTAETFSGAHLQQANTIELLEQEEALNEVLDTIEQSNAYWSEKRPGSSDLHNQFSEEAELQAAYKLYASWRNQLQHRLAELGIERAA